MNSADNDYELFSVLNSINALVRKAKQKGYKFSRRHIDHDGVFDLDLIKSELQAIPPSPLDIFISNYSTLLRVNTALPLQRKLIFDNCFEQCLNYNSFLTTTKAKNILEDFDYILSILGLATAEPPTLSTRVTSFMLSGNTSKKSIPLKYEGTDFRITAFKSGSMHLYFKSSNSYRLLNEKIVNAYTKAPYKKSDRAATCLAHTIVTREVTNTPSSADFANPFVMKPGSSKKSFSVS